MVSQRHIPRKVFSSLGNFYPERFPPPFISQHVTFENRPWHLCWLSHRKLSSETGLFHSLGGNCLVVFRKLVSFSRLVVLYKDTYLQELITFCFTFWGTIIETLATTRSFTYQLSMIAAGIHLLPLKITHGHYTAVCSIPLVVSGDVFLFWQK